MHIRAIDQHHSPFVTRAFAVGAIFCVMAALSTSASCALAQGVAGTSLLPQPSVTLSNSPASVAKGNVLRTTSTKPAWQDLTPSQQLSLKPLAANWNHLGEDHKRKWIAIAANYPSMAPIEQAKLHSRMSEWVSLSQQQRAQARLNFAESKQLTPNQKAATWQAYQALSPEEKQKLATSAKPKPIGAAAAVKPVPPQKLAVVPVTRQSPKQAPRVSVANHALNQHTLLPHPQSPVEPVPLQKN